MDLGKNIANVEFLGIEELEDQRENLWLRFRVTQKVGPDLQHEREREVLLYRDPATSRIKTVEAATGILSIHGPNET